ncbi:MAG: GNAT family N-acetyltransferase [Clostridiales bacterium]|nr:GNAT family N-acetyltransferase [Clostridiales bacterium]
MIKVENKMNYVHLFEEYEHSKPVIYSALEGQYDCDLYVNDEYKPEFAILFTQFDFHFVTGNKETNSLVSDLRDIIFRKHLKLNNLKEAILVTPDDKWQGVLKEVFKGYSDIIDRRCVYKLNQDKFKVIYDNTDFNCGLNFSINHESEFNSKIPYLTSRLKDNNKTISYCSGFMLGAGHAEIDVKTDDLYRQKGYGKLASLLLIKELLDHKIEPDWCCWESKDASKKLAHSIGFEKVNELIVYIWVEEVNGKL